MAHSTPNNHILQHMSDGFLSIDKNMIITDANHRFESYHGPKAGLIGKSIWDVMPELKGQLTDHKIQEALKYNEVRKYEDYNPRFAQWYEIRLIPTPSGVSFFYNDITERKVK